MGGGTEPRRIIRGEILRERYELFVHYNLSDVDMEEDFIDTFIREQIYDGGFKRRVMTNHEEWEKSESDPNDIEGRRKRKITTRMKKNSTTGGKQ